METWIENHLGSMGERNPWMNPHTFENLTNGSSNSWNLIWKRWNLKNKPFLLGFFCENMRNDVNNRIMSEGGCLYRSKRRSRILGEVGEKTFLTPIETRRGSLQLGSARVVHLATTRHFSCLVQNSNVEVNAWTLASFFSPIFSPNNSKCFE